MSERASYTDTFTHSFDQKGRITVPAEWREAPFEKNLTVMPTEQKCLRIYPASWLGRKQAELDADKNSTEMQHEQLADLASSSHSASLDAQGRIVIKAHLRERAGPAARCQGDRRVCRPVGSFSDVGRIGMEETEARAHDVRANHQGGGPMKIPRKISQGPPAIAGKARKRTRR